MKGEYAPDTFTENDVLVALENAGLRYRNGSRYILSQCPLHEDKNPSVQIYKDDWFVKCHAGCEGGRFHITRAFPSLRDRADIRRPSPAPTRKKKEPTVTHKDCTQEIMEKAKWLPMIPTTHYFKNIPIEVLDGLGWRFDQANDRYFIPYFSRSQKSIPFAQWRNLSGEVRFNFWKDAKPTMYGTWNLTPGEPIFLVEGTSDAAVMEFCAVPWIAAPSAASKELVKAMAAWCADNDVTIIYAGDNDKAGDALKQALDEGGFAYRRRQPREPYKDWGDMFEAEGLDSVQDYCLNWLNPKVVISVDKAVEGGDKSEVTILSDVENVQAVFPGAVQLKLIDTKMAAPKEQPKDAAMRPF